MQTEPINTHLAPVEEDEIDLGELASIIWAGKWFLLLFSFFITTIALLYTLSKPNEYESKSLLMPVENAKPSLGGGGLAALAGIAGVDLSSNSSPKPEDSYNTLLKEYTFMKSYILKYNLHKKLGADANTTNYKFALNNDTVYKLFNSPKTSNEYNQNEFQENDLFNTYKTLSQAITIISDKKSAILTISAKNPDPILAKEIVESFLIYASGYLKNAEMIDNNRKIDYYETEIKHTNDVALKMRLAELASALIQKKVLSETNQFYNVKQFIAPQIAFEKDHVGPKRALIILVASITSFIFGVFWILFINFFKNKKTTKSQ